MPSHNVDFSLPPKVTKKRLSKKGFGIGINLVAASIVSASSSAYKRMNRQENSSSDSPPKTVKTRPRSSTTVERTVRRPVFLDKSNTSASGHSESQSNATKSSDENLPVLTALWTKPALYEDLHTLSAYGELPIPLRSPMTPSILQSATDTPTDSQDHTARGPTSPTARLFEVAKPPAMAKRRRYTIASSKPSLTKDKETTFNVDGTKAPGSDHLGDVKEEDNSSSNGSSSDSVKQSASMSKLPKKEDSCVVRPSPIWSASAFVEPLNSCTTTGPLTRFPKSGLSSGGDILVPVASGLATNPSSPTTSSHPRGVNVNVRYIKHYPYMITELANTPRVESQVGDEGVLSRTKYRLVEV
ncbi:hypothetical protein EV360DRAFT_87579 [Lentinula raphanica]|nr:hypothetical protein EV360DRAFT_87579 [Lentinula raphanica]